MHLSLPTLLMIMLACTAVAWWWHARDAKEQALFHARRHCRKMGLILLDETAVLRRIRIARDAQGRLAIKRQYRFEFTVAGEARYNGSVTLLGKRMQRVWLAPHVWLPEDSP